MNGTDIVDLMFDLPQWLFNMAEILFEFLFKEQQITENIPPFRPIYLLAGVGLIALIVRSIIRIV